MEEEFVKIPEAVVTNDEQKPSSNTTQFTFEEQVHDFDFYFHKMLGPPYLFLTIRFWV